MTEKEKLEQKVRDLMSILSSSDYKIIKCYESSLVNEDTEYDIKALHDERQKIRDEINTIEKTIDDMTFDEEGIYHFTIEPKDTDKLAYGKYVFDIEVIDKNVKTTICRDEFKITEEVTFSENES